MIARTSLCLILVALGGSAWAQQTAETPSAPAKTPMALEVEVTDKAGHLVSGLQQQDFTVTDNGHPAQIRSFAAVNPENAQQYPTLIVLIVDEVNTNFRAVSNGRVQLKRFLTANQGQLPAPTTILFLTDNGLKQVTQPSQNGNELDATFEKEQSTLRSLGRDTGFYGRTDMMSVSLNALHSLATTTANVPGRKLVIWISHGWWLFDSPNIYLTGGQQRQIYQWVVDFSNLLRQSQISMYEVDPRGTDDAGSIYNTLWQGFLKPVTEQKQAQPGDVALQVMAAQTGGLILFGSNDIAGELGQCAADATTWYRLSIDTEPADKPNEWHTLQVKVNKPGLRVRTRNGYYAQP